MHSPCLCILSASASVHPSLHPLDSYFKNFLCSVSSNYYSHVHMFYCVDAAGTQNRNLVKQYIERQGSLPVRSLKSFLIGPSCVGKTSARRRLMGEIKHISPDEIVPSTGIDAPLTVRLHHPTEQSSVLLSQGWHSQGLEEQCQALCSYVINSPTQPSETSSNTSAPASAITTSPIAAPSRTNPLSKLTNLFKQVISHRSQATPAAVQVKLQQRLHKMMEQLLNVKQQQLKMN